MTIYRYFDFRCPEGHVEEHMVPVGTEENQCSCGAMGKRQIAAPRVKLEPFSGAFPGAADKWVRDRESHMQKEQRNKREHGTYK